MCLFKWVKCPLIGQSEQYIVIIGYYLQFEQELRFACSDIASVSCFWEDSLFFWLALLLNCHDLPTQKILLTDETQTRDLCCMPLADKIRYITHNAVPIMRCFFTDWSDCFLITSELFQRSFAIGFRPCPCSDRFWCRFERNCLV